MNGRRSCVRFRKFEALPRHTIEQMLRDEMQKNKDESGG